MANALDRVQMTVTGAPGTGTITLNAASPGYLSIATAGGLNATQYGYLLYDGPTNWEVGKGTYTSSGTTFSRDSVEINSSGTTSKITASANATVTLIVTAVDVSSFGAGAGSGGTTATGNVTLTSASPGAQTITTTAYGQFAKLPDATTMSKAACVFTIKNAGPYPLRIYDNSSNTLGFIFPTQSCSIGLADNSTAAGVWNSTEIELLSITAAFYNTTIGSTGYLAYRTTIDSNRTLLIIRNSSNLYGLVYDASTQTFGAPVVIRALGNITSACSYLQTTDRILVVSVSASSTAYSAVVLSLSGTTITVNTATTATNGNNAASGLGYIVALGSAFVSITPTSSGGHSIRAITISGTTITIGSEVLTTGTGGGSYSATSGPWYYIQAISSTVLAAISTTELSNVYCDTWTLSGTTLTAGTGTSFALDATYGRDFMAVPLASGARIGVVYLSSTSTQIKCSIISFSGSTASASTVTATSPSVASAFYFSQSAAIFANGTKIVFSETYSGYGNIITDTSGTASAGTALKVTFAGNNASTLFDKGSSKAVFVQCTGSYIQTINLDYSGSSLTQTNGFQQQAGSNAGSYLFNSNAAGLRGFGIMPNSINLMINTIINAPYTAVAAPLNGYPFQFLPKVSLYNTNWTYQGTQVGLASNETWMYSLLNSTTFVVLRMESIT